MAAELRRTLWIATLVASWSVSPAALANERQSVDPIVPGAFNATPLPIPAPDRSAVEEEIGAVMAMTPPDRRIMVELPSGSRLWIRPGAYERGPSGVDCRRFDYRYEAVGGGTAVVAGKRCLFPAAGAWLPLSPDAAVEVNGLQRAEPLAPLQDATWPAPQLPAAEARPPPPAAIAPPRQQTPAATAPPSRIILPFTPGG